MTDMIKMPAPRTSTCSVLRRSKIPTRQTSRYPTARLKRPHSTLTVKRTSLPLAVTRTDSGRGAPRSRCRDGGACSRETRPRRSTRRSGTSASCPPPIAQSLRWPPHAMPVLALRPVGPDAVEASDAGRLPAMAGHDREHLGRSRSRDIVVLGVEDGVATDGAGRGMGHVALTRRSRSRGRTRIRGRKMRP